MATSTSGIFAADDIRRNSPRLIAAAVVDGAADSLSATFLYNRAVKIPLLRMMVHYSGWDFTLALSIYMVLFSVINGVVVEYLTQGSQKK